MQQRASKKAACCASLVLAILPDVKYAALSVPLMRRKLARALPTTVVTAAPDLAVTGADHFPVRTRFRVYTNDDLIGVELGRRSKSIIALGAGISEGGLQLGDNTKAASRLKCGSQRDDVFKRAAKLYADRIIDNRHMFCPY